MVRVLHPSNCKGMVTPGTWGPEYRSRTPICIVSVINRFEQKPKLAKPGGYFIAPEGDECVEM